ncbi:MAG: hypothetical protein ACLFQK_10905 [Fibrobacterota bacterium]
MDFSAGINGVPYSSSVIGGQGELKNSGSGQKTDQSAPRDSFKNAKGNSFSTYNSKAVMNSQIISASFGNSSQGGLGPNSLIDNVIDPEMLSNVGGSTKEDWSASENVEKIIRNKLQVEFSGSGELNPNLLSVDNTAVNSDQSADSASQIAENTINTDAGWSSENNSVMVNGRGNNVDIAASAPESVSAETYRAVGGADVDNNSVNVDGDENSVVFEGGRQSNNSIAVRGNSNRVNTGRDVDNLDVSIEGDNVSVEVSADSLIESGGQDSWSVSVNADNVSVRIEDGNAVVEGVEGRENLVVEVDEKAKTVSIFEVAVSGQ